MTPKMQYLNLELSETIFIKNDDDTYTVYKHINDNSCMKFPKVAVAVTAVAFPDETTGNIWEMIDYKTPNKIKVLLTKFKRIFAKKEKSDA